MTEPAKTYTRIEAGEIFGVSNVIVSRNLKAVLDFGFDKSLFLTDDNRLTEEAIEAIRLYRAKETAALQVLADAFAATEAPAVTPTEVMPVSEGITAGIIRRTEEIEANTLAVRERTAQLEAFEIPTIEIEDIDVDVDELRALLGLSTSRQDEADAYRQQAAQHDAELERLKAIQDELDIAAIVADEQAKIEREQAIRTQVRKSSAGKQIKARAAVA